MFTKLNVKIKNWDEHPEINGVMFDRHRFNHIPEIYNNGCGYGSYVYACKCGTTFAANQYGVCPDCGNRDFSQRDFWDATIVKDTCFITMHKYVVKQDNDDLIIVKTSSEFKEFADERVNYDEVYAKYPELLDIPKYKYLHDIAHCISSTAIPSTWWTASKLSKVIFEETGKYDMELSKLLIDAFPHRAQLTSFLNASSAHELIAFIKAKPYNIELLKRITVSYFAGEYDKINAIPQEIIEAATKSHGRDILPSLLAALDLLKKHRFSTECISALVYYFEHINCNADYRKDMDIFVEWALKIKEEISMDNFYWYLNLKHIQRSGMNENYKKILANFDKDPINSIIKLAK